jgi:hypothetical protein
MTRSTLTQTLALMMCLASTPTVAQALTDAEVADSIKAGQAKKFDHLVSDCNATAGFGEGMAASMAGGLQRDGSYSLTLSTNAGRIAYMAARAKRLYKPFSLETVTEDLRAPAVIVSVEPNEPTRGTKSVSVPAVIEHVVLKSKTKADISIQPSHIEIEPVEFSNLLGAKIESSRAVAFFSFDAVKELPPGEFDMVVITPQGERRCKVGLKDRSRLFPK